MSIIERYIEEEEQSEGYTPPAVLRGCEEDSLKKSVVISTILHPAVVFSAWLMVFILALLGIHLHLFERPAPKVNDIQFVLVDKEDNPVNKNTKNRADINSRTGGVNNPQKQVSMPSPPPGPKAPEPQKTVSKPSPAPQPAKPQPVKQPTAPQPAAQKPSSQPVTQAPAAPEQAKPQPPTARPSLQPPMTPKVSLAPTSPFQVPVPKGGTSAGQYSTGPISGSGTSSTGGGSSGGSTSSGAPSPSLAPTGGAGSPSGSQLAKGGGGGMGGGNPGGGGGRPGIDAIREPDFGPYMRELQRRIKMNWEPPKGNESKRVVLLFKIAKDGRLLSCSVFKSSGLPSADKAAINAVQLTAPFRPLPADFSGQSIDIQFTFDYNVFGAAGYQ